MTRSIPEFVTENSRAVVAAMLLLTVVVGAGVPLVERSTSLDQFQGDTPESDALDYVEANFTSTNGGGTVSQVIVEGNDVLAKGSLLAVLDYQQAIHANETVNGSLASDDPTRSVASAVATTAYAEARVDDLDDRERELNATSDALHEALTDLERDENASVEAAFDAVAANASTNLTDEDYATFADAAGTLRNASANDTATREAAFQQGTQGVLADEYDALRADYAAVRDGVEPTLAEQSDALAALNESEVDALVARTLDNAETGTKGVRTLLPTDYESGSTDVNATLLVVAHETNATSFAAGNAPQGLIDAELAMQAIANDHVDAGGDAGSGDAGSNVDVSYLVFGTGVVADETQTSMTDSLVLVGPLALAFVVLVLVLAYRDLLDVLLGVVGVGLVLVWTFGVMGWVGIAFNQPFIIVVVLLIGLSIDYAIHVVMRYREAKTDGTSASAAMRTALGSVGPALVVVTATTVIGFLSNLASPLGIFRQIGVVSAIGIVATLLVFGVLVPAVKTELDAFLDARGHDRGGAAVGTDGGVVQRALEGAVAIAKRAPVAALVVALLVSAGGAYGATQVDTSFADRDFLADDPDDWVADLPEPFAPSDYHAKQGMDVLNDRFVRQDSEATVLVEGDVTDPGTLNRLDAATANASTMSATAAYPNGDPAIESPLSVMESVAATNASFNATLAAADTDSDGVPDRNVTAVYDELYRVAPEQAATVLHRTDDGTYAAAKMTISVDGAAEGSTITDQARWVATDVEGGGDGVAGDAGEVEATATGQVVINAITADQLLETVVQGLVVALLAALAFLVVTYRVTEGAGTLGAVLVLPVAFTVTWVLGSMWLLDVPFNIVTGLITSLTIGLGIDYSIHVGERFTQALDATGDVDAALDESVTGTGGALLSSAATTASGFGVLTVALLPFLQAFGVITALTIVYAFLASVLVLPSALALWARWTGRGTTDAPSPVATEHGDPALADSGFVAATTTDAPATASAPTTADEPTTTSAKPAPDSDATALRSFDDAVAAPGGAVDVTVAVRTPGERVLLRERTPERVDVHDVSPTPVRVVANDHEVFALWDAPGTTDVDSETDDDRDTHADTESEAWRRLSYTVDVPEDARDGATLAFDGTVATATEDRTVAGDRELAVVADVFQRVLERGEATDADVDVAATQFEADALTDAEFERLCRAWVTDDPQPPAAFGASDD